MGLFDALGGLFGNDTEEGATINLEQLMPAFQKETGQQLADWIKKYMNQYVPGEAFPGNLSIDSTSQEKTGLSLLDKYLGGQNTGDLFSAGKKQISDTLAGKFADPNASPFIKAMQEVSNQDLNDAINNSRLGTGTRGKFFSTASLGEEKDLTNRNLQNMNSIIGSFIQNERQNMLNAVPVGNAMDQYELQTAPLAKVQASQTLGSLNRTLEQADLERQYNAWANQRAEMSQPITSAQAMYGTQSQYGIPSWQMPSTQTTNSFGSIMNALKQLLPGGSTLGDLGSSLSGALGSGDIMSTITSMLSGLAL